MTNSTTSSDLLIVMYHYVRDMKATAYPNLKALDIDRFQGQIDYLRHHHEIVNVADVVHARAAGEPLPARAALLTFDDGYLDHHETVLPILDQQGIGGAFFVPASAVKDRRVLQVNKIQFVLATVDDLDGLIDVIERRVEDATTVYRIEPLEALREAHFSRFRYDGPETMYVKRLLQFALPEQLRADIIDELFAMYVSQDEADFAASLYMSEDQVTELHQAGMHVGGHGNLHNWLSRLSDDEIVAEIDATSRLLDGVVPDQSERTFCYPYGDFDERVVETLSTRGYSLAFTTVTGVANVANDHHLKLPRVDTNELPTETNAGAA